MQWRTLYRGVRQFCSFKTDVEANKIAVFSKTTCGFCFRAKQFLREGGFEPFVVELNLEEQGKTLHEALKKETGQGTVPYVFIGGELIGGYDELSAMSFQEIKEKTNGIKPEK